MLCHRFPANELPRRAIYLFVQGGTTETPCSYRCISDEYHMPNSLLLARIYAFGNIMSLINVIAFVCGYTHMKSHSSSEKDPSLWNVSMDENGWWILPTGLVFC